MYCPICLFRSCIVATIFAGLTLLLAVPPSPRRASGEVPPDANRATGAADDARYRENGGPAAPRRQAPSTTDSDAALDRGASWAGVRQ